MEEEREELKKQFIIGNLEQLTKTLMDLSENNPDEMIKLHKALAGEEKLGHFITIMDSGVSCSPFLAVTSMYLHNKNNFLNGDLFFSGF